MGRQGDIGRRECFASEAAQITTREFLELLFPTGGAEASLLDEAEKAWTTGFGMWLSTRDFILEGKALGNARDSVREALEAARTFRERFAGLRTTLKNVAYAEGVAHSRAVPEIYTTYAFSRTTRKSKAHPNGIMTDDLRALAPFVIEPFRRGVIPSEFVDRAVSFNAGEPLHENWPLSCKINLERKKVIPTPNREYFTNLTDFENWFDHRFLASLENLANTLPSPKGARSRNSARRWLAEIHRSIFDEFSEPWRRKVDEPNYRAKRLAFVEAASAQAHDRLRRLKKEVRGSRLDDGCVCNRVEVLMNDGAAKWEIPPDVGTHLPK